MVTIYGRSAVRRPGKVVRPPEKSPTERGYDAKWRRYSEAFRQKNPFCVFCLQQGRTTLVVLGKTGVVDHKWPVSKGGSFWDPKNHHSLCVAHHSGLKARLESYAELTGQLDQLPRWCDDPTSRPTFRGDVPCDATGAASSSG